jgi:hypothetical protein
MSKSEALLAKFVTFEPQEGKNNYKGSEEK